MNYKITTDLHTHTNASTHAYSSLYENCIYASKNGIELIAMTNHGPKSVDSPYIWHFEKINAALPSEIENIRVLYGIEANIVDNDGSLDLDEHLLADLELVIASYHKSFPALKNKEDILPTYIKILNNPTVHMLGHLDRNPHFNKEIIEEIIRLASKNNKIIEINEGSFKPCYIEKSEKYLPFILEMAIKHKALISVNSDAHFFTHIGNYPHSITLLEQLNFPLEQIINRNKQTILNFLNIK